MVLQSNESRCEVRYLSCGNSRMHLRFILCEVHVSHTLAFMAGRHWFVAWASVYTEIMHCCRHDDRGSIGKEGRQEVRRIGGAPSPVGCWRELRPRLLCAGAAGPLPCPPAPQGSRRWGGLTQQHTDQGECLLRNDAAPMLLSLQTGLLPLAGSPLVAWVISASGAFEGGQVGDRLLAAAGNKTVERFRCLGRAMAKALQDSRLLDIPLSYTFYRSATHSMHVKTIVQNMEHEA